MPDDTVIVDVHIHLYQTKPQGEQMKEDFVVWEYGPDSMVEYRSGAGDIEDTIAGLDDAGVSHAVAVNCFATYEEDGRLVEDHPRDDVGVPVPLSGTLGRDRLIAYNEWLCDLAAEHPRIIPFIGIDPWVIGPDEIGPHIRELVTERGARGVKLQPAYSRFHVQDERVLPVYETCSELGVPVLSHSGANANDYSAPNSFVGVMEQFPELDLILAHMGGAEWRQTAAFAERFPTVTFDISEFISRIDRGWQDGPSFADAAQLIKDVGPERVMMGSDFPWYDLHDIIERVRGLPLLSVDEREAILGANAVRILGIEGARAL